MFQSESFPKIELKWSKQKIIITYTIHIMSMTWNLLIPNRNINIENKQN